MSKTNVHFLRKNRSFHTEKIKAGPGYMDFEKGLYIVDPKQINRIAKDGILIRGSELFFFEGNSSPVPTIVKKDEDGEQDPSADYLDKMVYINFLEQTGDPRAERLKDMFKLIRPLTDPATLFRYVFFFIIVISILRGYISEWLASLSA